MPQHEGEKLVAVLKAHGKNQADMARALGCSNMTITKYVKMPTWGRRAWESIQHGLEVLGIDPIEVRPPQQAHAAVSAPTSGSRGPTYQELRPYVSGLGKKQLENLRAVLDLDFEAQDRLRLLIDAALGNED